MNLLRQNNRLSVWLRRSRYVLTRILLGIAAGSRRRLVVRHSRSIIAYPPTDNHFAVGDLLNRIACALPGYRDPVGSVDVIRIVTGTDFRSAKPPKSQTDYITRFIDNARIETLQKSQLTKAVKEAELILLWRASALLDPLILANLGKVLLVDPDFYLAHEPYNYARLPFLLLHDADRKRGRENSIRRFGELHAKFHGSDTAYVLVTGPTLTGAVAEALEANAVKIICNSIVKDNELLDRIQPDILVFADPVFHFGPSRYAEEFRQHVRIVLRRFPKCYCIVPEMFAAFLESHLGEFSSRIIGMPQSRGAINFPMPDRMHVKVTANIMTLLMLPLAAALSRKVVIIGADGREKSEKYYWKHNSKVQFSDLMSAAFETHPSFLRDRVLGDYYDSHCTMVARILEKAESEMHCNIVTRTPSFIPALDVRGEGNDRSRRAD